MAYSGYVVKIERLREHMNADRLKIATVFGNDVVVGLDVEIGDTMLYFPTDGQLSYEFAYNARLLREDREGNKLGGYLDPNKRNIRAIKLRGENSDGLLLRLSSLETIISDNTINNLEVGDKIDVLDGVLLCRKYVPRGKVSKQGEIKPKNPKSITLKEQFPQFAEHVDTNQFAYNINDFKEGDVVTATLKLHGTSGRTMYGLEKKKRTIKDKIFDFFSPNKKDNHSLISGTRKTILHNFNGGFYGSNEFRKKHHDFFEGKLQKGETVYYEIVGWVNESTPIMPIADNKKIKDKNFITAYGEKTIFSYGCERGESDIYIYRMTKSDEEGNVFEYPTWLAQLRCEQMGVKHVPVLEQFIVVNDIQLLAKAKKYEDGHDLIDPRHVREGVVFRIENREKFKAYKQKGFAFKVLEGIIKEDAVEADIEEQESE